jgi:hypothetical protein
VSSPYKRNAELTQSFFSIYLSQGFLINIEKCAVDLFFSMNASRDQHEGFLSSRTNLQLDLNPAQSGSASETLMSYGLLVTVFSYPLFEERGGGEGGGAV